MNAKELEYLYQGNNENEKLLLLKFCQRLNGDRTLAEFVEDYNFILYNKKEFFITAFEHDINYLMKYKERKGSYPLRFLILFNEWLLTKAD